MRDLTDDLAALGRSTPAAPDPALDDLVRGDLRRGRAALHRRRRRRGLIAAGAAVVVAGLVAATTLLPSPPHDAPQAARPGPPSTGSTTTDRGSTTPAPVDLVAYHGVQAPGFRVSYVPTGYVVQGVSDSVVDVTPPGDRTSLDDFRGKLVLMLNDHPGTSDGQPVHVRAQPGRLAESGGWKILTYDDEHGHHVAVQSAPQVGITGEQVVRFAAGVTVTAAARAGHG